MRPFCHLPLSFVVLAACKDTKPGGDGNGSLTDGDGDGFPTADDCDDANGEIHPGASEICDGLDNDCDGLVDDDDDSLDPASTAELFLDADGDGHGDPDTAQMACPGSNGLVADDSDCNDGDATISPSAAEVCNERDDNCDGLADDEDPHLDPSTATPFYTDADADGYGDPATQVDACVQPPDTITEGADCDDGDADIHTAALEVCNGVDDDCDEAVDDDDPDVDLSTGSVWFTDDDGDGYGDAEAPVTACAQPAGAVDDDTDCDDGDETINPGTTEWIADGIDNDCDPATDDLLTGGEFTPAAAATSVYGIGAYDGVGAMLASGDFDGDGTPDVLIGGTSNATVYAMFGPITSETPVSAAGATISGADSGGLNVPMATADLDGDGYTDLWAGAPSTSPGFAYLVHGPLSGANAITDIADATLTAASGTPWFGYSIDLADDLTGDGIEDIIVGAPIDRTLAPAGGAVHIFSADHTGTSTTADAHASITGAARYDQLGGAVASGDIDGDGVEDLVIAGSTNTNGGDVYVFHGPVTGEMTNAAADVTILGSGGDLFAHSVASGFDHDGDGREDIIVGATYDTVGGTSSGAAYVFSGGAASGTISKSGYQARVVGSPGAYVGNHVYGVDDYDGDGLGDVWVAAYDGASDGASSLFLGPVAGSMTTADAFIHIESNYQGRAIGSGFTETADIDGDGRPDFWLGAPGASTTVSTVGKAFLFRSSDL